jgi:hypothetical protein
MVADFKNWWYMHFKHVETFKGGMNLEPEICISKNANSPPNVKTASQFSNRLGVYPTNPAKFRLPTDQPFRSL